MISVNVGTVDIVNLKINNIPVRAAAGSTILQAAHAAGIAIPTLCYLKEINEIGACRVCVVEVKGMKNLVPACVHPISEGMEVFTNNERVQAARRTNLKLIDTSIDYDNLLRIGTMMGSGGMIVMDEDTCMVDIAKFFLEFTVDESCGKCTPCRVGTKRLLELLNKITEGRGTMEDLSRIEELAAFIKENSLCGLGQTAPNPVLSTLRYFRDEYVAHIEEKRCPAGVCKNLLSYRIDPNLCRGCTACTKSCPTGAIAGSPRNPHKIDTQKCIRCGSCMEKCRFGAIVRG